MTNSFHIKYKVPIKKHLVSTDVISRRESEHQDYDHPPVQFSIAIELYHDDDDDFYIILQLI